jgi:hypothetical protein
MFRLVGNPSDNHSSLSERAERMEGCMGIETRGESI